MNVCLLNDSFPPLIDGVANTVVNYANNLMAHGSNPIVVTPNHPDADDKSFNYPVLRYPSIDVRDQVGYMAGYPFSPTVIKALEEAGTQLLHSHCPVASTMLARSIKLQLKVPVILTYHTKFDIDIAKAVRTKVIQKGAIKALVSNVASCDEVWVVSHGAGENLKSLGYKGDYIVMENGVDVPRRRLEENRYMELTSGYDLPRNLPTFLFVGRLMWYKGIRIILDALAAIKSQGIDFRMVFVGGGADKEEMESYTEQLGLTDKVLFLGPIYDREELCAWYCRSDLFLFPSSYDTNGLVVREAAACGLASALISGSCAAEGVTNRRNGYLVEENAASLAVLLTQISGDKQAMRKCGELAAEELYLSWEDSVKKAEERYQVVLDNFKSGRKKKSHRPLDEFFEFQGELMDLFAEAKHSIGTRTNDIFDRYL